MMNSENDYDSRPPRRQGFGPVPVREGETYDVTIEGIGEKGDGIAKIQGFVIVVPKTQQGQRVKVKITAVRGKVSFGEVVGEATTPAEEPAAAEDEEEQ
jgi:predicted RNA-binding protein with TRAM domain